MSEENSRPPVAKKVVDRIDESLLEPVRKRKLSRNVHHAIQFAFSRAGFQFEVRNRGDAKMGLWRFPLTRQKALKGPKRRFVLVPGFGDTPLSWLPVLAPLHAVLARSHDEIVCLDFPGFGGMLSEEPAFESMDEFREMFREILDSLRPDILMGHSLGGWLASDYAAETDPALQPKKLILANTSGMVGDEAEKEKWRQHWESAFQEGFSSLRPHVFGREPFWFRFVADEFTGFLNQPEVQNFVRSIREDHLLETRAAKIRSEVSLIWGEIDTLTPPEWIHLWGKALKDAGLTPAMYLIRNAGHTIQLEKPGATLAVLSQIILGKKAPKILSSRFWKEL